MESFYWRERKEIAEQFEKVEGMLERKGLYDCFDDCEVLIAGKLKMVKNFIEDDGYIYTVTEFYFGERLLLKVKESYPDFVELLFGSWNMLWFMEGYLEGLE